MRVTYRSINSGVQKTLMKRYSDLTKLQEMLSTGKRLLRPSDDPSDVSNDLKLRSRIKQLNQLHRNITDGLSYMQVTDSAMMSMDTLLQRLRELAIQASSDTLTNNERLFIASEVEQLLRQTIAIANTSYKGDYVFAGTQTKIMPFPVESSQANAPEDYTNFDMAYYDASAVAPGTAVQIFDAFTNEAITNIIPGSFQLSVAGTVYVEGTDFSIDYANGTITIDPTSPAAALLSADVLNGNIAGVPNYSQGGFQMTFDYVGKGQDIYGQPVDNNGEVLREVESGIVVPINISSEELLVDEQNNVDMLNVIISFGQALIQDNLNGVRSTIGDIDVAFKNLLAAQSKNGARVNRFEITLDRNETQSTEATRLHSELEDADLAEVATQYSVTEMVYNAALKTAAKIIQPSLVNFL